MNYSVARNAKFVPKSWDNEKDANPIEIEYLVLTAQEAEEVITRKPQASDTEIFRKYVTNIRYLSVNNETVATAEEFLQVPASYPIVTETAKEIVSKAFLGTSEKNG